MQRTVNFYIFSFYLDPVIYLFCFAFATCFAKYYNPSNKGFLVKEIAQQLSTHLVFYSLNSQSETDYEMHSTEKWRLKS